MKFESLFIGLTAASVASAAAVAGAIPEKEIIESLLTNNGFLMLPSDNRILRERTRRIVKRTPQVPKGVTPAKGAGSPDLGALIAGLMGGGAQNKNAPNSSVPEKVDLPAQAWKEAKRTKVRYGPYRIPPTSENNVESQVLNVQGMSNTLKIGARKPCDTECTMLALFADLEYADGSAANNANGAWLHHIVLLNSGPNVIEPNCGAGKVENIFMSGNERTTGGFALPNSTIKSGYSLTPKDSFILTTQLMNMEDKEKWAWVTITYEYLEGAHPDYKQGKTVWQSIGPQLQTCGNKVQSPWGPSNLTASQQPKIDIFTEHSMPWIAPKDGWLMSAGGHMHDGGISTEIFRNSERICNSVPIYGMAPSKAASPGEKAHGHGDMAKRQMMGSGAGNTDIPHILKQDACLFPDGIPMKKGDNMYLQVNYNFKEHPGMKNKKGELDEIMGIVGSLVAF